MSLAEHETEAHRKELFVGGFLLLGLHALGELIHPGWHGVAAALPGVAERALPLQEHPVHVLQCILAIPVNSALPRP